MSTAAEIREAFGGEHLKSVVEGMSTEQMQGFYVAMVAIAAGEIAAQLAELNDTLLQITSSTDKSDKALFVTSASEIK